MKIHREAWLRYLVHQITDASHLNLGGFFYHVEEQFSSYYWIKANPLGIDLFFEKEIDPVFHELLARIQAANVN